jgi:hypothetical protein
MASDANSERYYEFLQKVWPTEIALRTCAAKFDRPRYWARVRGKKPSDELRRLDTRYQLEDVGANYFDASGVLRLTIQDKKNRRTLVEIACAFEAHLHLRGNQPIRREHARRFAESELRVVLWPYFREFVTDISSKMSIPPLLIPVSLRVREDAPGGAKQIAGRRKLIRSRK